MNVDEEVADRAEKQLGDLKNACADSGYSSESRARLWAAFRSWVDHPMFVQHPGALRCLVLNELTFCLGGELEDEAWGLVGELAERWDGAYLGNLMESIRISTFEVIAEAPEVEDGLIQLFAMARNPHRRWAVFAAYENVPWRLRPHAHKYSGGSITDQDCDDWLINEGYGEDEILMGKHRAPAS